MEKLSQNGEKHSVHNVKLVLNNELVDVTDENKSSIDYIKWLTSEQTLNVSVFIMVSFEKLCRLFIDQFFCRTFLQIQ
jgi:hypothetical protein